MGSQETPNQFGPTLEIKSFTVRAPSGAEGVNLRLLNPFDPKTDRLLEKSSGSYLKAYDWSPDDKSVVYCDFTSNTASSLWLIDIVSGKNTLLSEKSDKPELYDFPQFSKDGKGIYVVRITIQTFDDWPTLIWPHERSVMFRPLVQWDVEEFPACAGWKNLGVHHK